MLVAELTQDLAPNVGKFGIRRGTFSPKRGSTVSQLNEKYCSQVEFSVHAAGDPSAWRNSKTQHTDGHVNYYWLSAVRALRKFSAAWHSGSDPAQPSAMCDHTIRSKRDVWSVGRFPGPAFTPDQRRAYLDDLRPTELKEAEPWLVWDRSR